MNKKTIQEWINVFADAMQKKYSENFDKQDKRLDYLKQELEDIIIARKLEKGILNVTNPESKEGHGYVDLDERVVGLLANVFALIYVRNTNIDTKLHEGLEWFLDRETKTSSEK